MGLSSALLCVALTVYHEARGEPFEGQLAVARVVHNRAGGMPSRYCRVVYQPGQFSWVALKPRVDTRSKAWASSIRVARSFRSFPDVSHGAMFFHERSDRPYWSRGMIRVARIGGHYFYKEV